MKIAFVFSGQGAQYAGMGKDLYTHYDIVRSHFDAASKIHGSDLTNVMFTDERLLKQTDYAQPAIFTLSTAITKLLKTEGITSDASCGLSLGEYSALYDANVVDFETGLKILMHRAEFMAECANQIKGQMLAMIGDYSAVKNLVETIDDLYIANYNGPNQIVVGGTISACDAALKNYKNFNIKRAMPLFTAGAFHTPLMQTAQTQFKAYLQNITFIFPNKALYLNTTASRACSNIKEIMIEQMTQTVLFAPMIQKMIDEGIDTFIEIGPKDTLKRLIQKINGSVQVMHIEDVETFQNTVNQIRGVIHAI